MSAPQKLTPQEIESRRREVPDWDLDGDRLRREFRFADFVEAFGFMGRVALLAERHDHHPDWSNVYNRVVVAWSTHDVGGLSARDFELAALCDRHAAATVPQ